jgi:hypothetical protein
MSGQFFVGDDNIGGDGVPPRLEILPVYRAIKSSAAVLRRSPHREYIYA